MSAASTRSGGQKQPSEGLDLGPVRAALASDLDALTTRWSAEPTKADLLTLLAVTTGVGKTHALMDLVARDRREWLVICPTTLGVVEWAEGLALRGALPGEYKIHRPRSYASSAGKALCAHLESAEAVGAQNHPPSQSLCRDCPHGYHAVWELAGGNPELSAEIHARMEKWHRDHPDLPHPLDVAPCGYLLELADVRQARVLITTAAAFSESMLYSGAGADRTPRAVIIDEIPNLMADALVISAVVVDKWVLGAEAGLNALPARIERAERDGDDKRLKALAAASRALPDAIRALKELRDCFGAEALDLRRVGELAAVLGQVAKEAKTGSSTAAALWESVDVAWENGEDSEPKSSVDAALRAAKALAFACKRGSITAEPGYADQAGVWHGPRLHFSAPTALGEWLSAGPSPTHPVILADATPLRSNRAAVASLGGSTREYHPPISGPTRDSSKSWARGLHIEADAPGRAQELARRAKLWGAPDPVVVGHGPDVEQLVALGLGKQEDTGWWGGAMTRGHNHWSGRPMLIVSAPFLAPAAAEMAYLSDRALALAAGASEEEWPAWDGERILTPGRSVYALEAIQRWDDDRMGCEITQVIGRVRPLEHPGTPVHLLGPRIDLSPWGISVDELDEDLADKEQRRKIGRAELLVRGAEACARLERRGEKVTKITARAEGLRGRHDIYTELNDLRKSLPSWKEVEAYCRAELQRAKAETGFLAVVKTVTTKRGPRTVVVVVVDKDWLLAQRGRVVCEIRPKLPTRRNPIRFGGPQQACGACATCGP